MAYIVELQEGCWLAPWRGDPGRTLVETSAQQFETAEGATHALAQARRYRPFANAVIRPAQAPEVMVSIGVLLEQGHHIWGPNCGYYCPKAMLRTGSYQDFLYSVGGHEDGVLFKFCPACGAELGEALQVHGYLFKFVGGGSK